MVGPLSFHSVLNLFPNPLTKSRTVNETLCGLKLYAQKMYVFSCSENLTETLNLAKLDQVFVI